MSALKEKSKQNFDAAKLLMDQGYLTPSVHCSYYSCLQLLKYSIKFFFGVEYSDLNRNIAASNKNSHQYIIDYVYNELARNLGSYEARMFKRDIKDLKFFREESDYDDIIIEREKCNKAYTYAMNLRDFLRNNLHL